MLITNIIKRLLNACLPTIQLHWEGDIMTNTKRLTNDALAGIEAKLCADPLTAQDVVTFLSDFRKQYLLENPVPNVIENKPSPLYDYTREINSYFGRPIMESCGMTILSDQCKDRDTMSLDLQQLIILREEGKVITKRKSIGEIFREVFSFSSKKIGETGALYYAKKTMEKSTYEKALPKYYSFFQQLKTTDLKSLHMHHSDHNNLPSTKDTLVDSLLSAVVINCLYVTMRDVTYDLDTNKVLKIEEYS